MTYRIAGLATVALAIAAFAAPAASAQEAPGHIVLAGSRVAATTSGRIGSPVTLSRFSPRSPRQDFSMDNFASPYGAGSFFWAPGGRQTNDYLVVTTSGARLVTGAPRSTVFDPVQAGRYTVLALPGRNGAPSRNVLTDSRGRLVIAPEGRRGPSRDQLWTLR